jgi:hypothetical protein
MDEQGRDEDVERASELLRLARLDSIPGRPASLVEPCRQRLGARNPSPASFEGACRTSGDA